MRFLGCAAGGVRLRDLMIGSLSKRGGGGACPLFFTMRRTARFVRHCGSGIGCVDSCHRPTRHVCARRPIASNGVTASNRNFVGRLLA